MINDKKNLLVSALCVFGAFAVVLAFFWLLYQHDNKYTTGPPYGKGGTFAFTQEDLTRNQLLFLIDGWELYPDLLLTPEDFQLSNHPLPEYIFIGQYPNFSYLSATHSPFGQATYRLNLHYEGEARILALEIPEIFTDFRLWIDEQEIKPKSGAIVFEADENTQLVLAVANQSHYYSGLTYPPALGTPESIQQMFFMRHLFYSVLCLVPLTLCLYAIAGKLSRERSRRFAHFGLLCLFFAFHCAHPFIHQLNWTGTLWYALEDVTWLAMLYEIIALCTMEAGLAQRRWYRRGVRPLAIGICAFSGVAVVFILPNFAFLINTYGNLMDGGKMLTWFYLLGCATWGLSTKQDGANLILVASGVLGASLVVNLLDNNRFEPILTGWQTEYAGFLLVLLFWLLTICQIEELLHKNSLLTEHLAEEVSRRTAELHGVLDERKAFFSDLAHNLKAPMAAIGGFTQLILQGNLYLDEDLRSYLNKISGANQELHNRVQALGDLNAFDKITEPFRFLDLDKLLSQVYADNEPEAAISGIVFRVEKLNAPVFLYGQETKVLILFENLIYNAFSFTPEDGNITITPRLGKDEVIIEVADTGAGIAPEHLPHVFERFYSNRQNKNEGSGLGLYIAKITVLELGGTLEVASVVGQGTVFTLRLPVAQNDE